MKISGFSFVRNGVKLYYPVKESIESILPIVDEFVVAIGLGDDDDNTRETIQSINSDKIKIIDTVWDEVHCKRGAVNAIQTDIAKSHCTGDWLIYLQADELIHEKYLDNIYNRCKQLKDNDEVEGLLFDYKHFWGDYQHHHQSHGWYPKEIRIIRNLDKIHSWQSAQSFRYFVDEYNGTHQEVGTRKLKVAKANAEIYHYGWVRPPHLMKNKMKALGSVHMGKEKANEVFDKMPLEFDYGPLDTLKVFDGSHPKVMASMISKFNWADKLQHSGKPNPIRMPHKHEKPKYKFLSFIENNFFGGKQIGGFKNYVLLEDI